MTAPTAKTALANSMTEAQLLAHVRAEAKRLGWLMYHTYRSDRSEKGFPDLVLVRDRRLVFAEFKTMVGRVSAEQMQWLTALTCAGDDSVRTAIWRPTDWYSGEITRVLT